MKYFLDTEFIEYPGTINLISIGIVDERGGEYYAVNIDCDFGAANPWVQEHVIPYLYDGVPDRSLVRFTRPTIAQQIRGWIGHTTPEFWGYYCDYDWVVFCWLFGAMIDLPPGWPMYCRDIQQWCDTLGNPRLPEIGTHAHHALADARWNKHAWEFLSHDERSRKNG